MGESKDITRWHKHAKMKLTVVRGQRIDNPKRKCGIGYMYYGPDRKKKRRKKSHHTLLYKARVCKVGNANEYREIRENHGRVVYSMYFLA